jgi:SOS-response transcriptional repressor LexA
MHYLHQEEHIPRAVKVKRREKEILEIIVKHHEKHHYSPSVRDIKRKASISSLSTIHKYINKLIEHGYLQRKQEGYRSYLEIIKSEYK